jgi:hypothetical protein
MTYNTGTLANCVAKACVILMRDEDQILFEPNVYNGPPNQPGAQDLQQV